MKNPKNDNIIWVLVFVFSISPIQRIDQLLLKNHQQTSVRFYRFHSLLTTNWVLMMNLHLTSGTFFVLDINQITLKTKIENLINDQKSKRLNKRITLVVYITVSSMSNSIRGNLLIKKKSKTVLLLFIILNKGWLISEHFFFQIKNERICLMQSLKWVKLKMNKRIL